VPLQQRPSESANYDIICTLCEYEDAKYPMKKGLSPSHLGTVLLVMTPWRGLSGTNRDENYRIHLVGKIYARANVEYSPVDIWQYFVPAGAAREIPTKKGITLRRFQWNSPKGHLADMLRLLNNLRLSASIETLLRPAEPRRSRGISSLYWMQPQERHIASTINDSVNVTSLL